MYQKTYQIHFVGIGGIGMSGIAELLISLGYKVSGSDVKPSKITDRLKKQGATIYIKHKKEQIKGASVVVTSTAISADNSKQGFELFNMPSTRGITFNLLIKF